MTSLLLDRTHHLSLFPHGIAISTGIQKHVNEGINKSKGCDGSGSGGRLNRPLALLQIKNIDQKMQHELDHYILLHTSDCSHFHPKIICYHLFSSHKLAKTINSIAAYLIHGLSTF